MKTKLVSAFLVASLVGAAHSATWLSTWSEAQKASQKTKKPILVQFTGSDWCGWCIKLDKEVFTTKAFDEWAKKNVVLLRLDFPREKKQTKNQQEHNAAMAKKYNVRGFPTILFVNSKGDVLGQSGYMQGGPSAWTKNADQQLKS